MGAIHEAAQKKSTSAERTTTLDRTRAMFRKRGGECEDIQAGYTPAKAMVNLDPAHLDPARCKPSGGEVRWFGIISRP
jgi:hypothetical protein